MAEPKTLKIDDVEYVRKDSIQELALKHDGMRYCIIRTYSAGVHAGYVARREGKEVDLVDSRRLWYWVGACSLSQLALEGVKDVDSCKFAMQLPEITLTEAVEIIPCSAEAVENIQGVPVWKK